MDLAELERRLLAAARTQHPDDRVPYAFEKRVMAHLSGKALPDRFAFWAAGLWRAAASCVAIMVLLSAWSFFTPAGGSQTGDLSQEFEKAVLAATDQDTPAETTW